jgi:hypothetical protein
MLAQVLIAEASFVAQWEGLEVAATASSGRRPRLDDLNPHELRTGDVWPNWPPSILPHRPTSRAIDLQLTIAMIWR